jgi:hypothetical protein
MALREALTAILICANAVPALAQWYRYPQGPAEARAATRHKINKDLFEIDELAREMERELKSSAPGDLPKAAKHAGKIAKLSHDAWKTMQGGKPGRPDPKLDPKPQPRSVDEATAEAAALRTLLDEIRRGVAIQQRTQTIDARLTVELVEKLERLELSARRIEIDAGERATDSHR